jgi:hypothetical protein
LKYEYHGGKVKNLKVFRLLAVLLLLVILLQACVPASFQDTTLVGGNTPRHVYTQVYNQSMELWRQAAIWAPIWMFIAVCVTGAIVAFFFLGSGNGCASIPTLIFFGFLALVAAGIMHSNIQNRGPTSVKEAAENAMTAGIDTKKQEVSERYAELLNFTYSDLFPADNYGISDSEWVKICHAQLNANTNCWPYEVTYEVNRTCTTDEDGDESCTSDTQHDPVFKHLVRYGAQVAYLRNDLLKQTRLVEAAGNPDHPYMMYSEWMIPMDYKNHYWGFALFRGSYEDSEFTPPSDWRMYKNIANVQGILGATSWHQYSNPLLATANADFMGDPATLDLLESRAMLLQPRDLYSPVGGAIPTYFDFVYPLGSLANLDYDWEGFQEAARAVNLYYGNTLHIVNSYAFVDEAELLQTGVDLDTLTYSLKADMYREQKWQRKFGNSVLYTIMQQNTLLTVCAVSREEERTYIKPTNCRVVVGLPIGNEMLKEAFISGTANEMQNAEFTPQGFFGQPTLRYSDNGDLVLEGTSGSPVGMLETYGARKPSMGDNFGYLVDRIQLGTEEIEQVVSAAVAIEAAETNAFSHWPKMILLAYVVIGIFLFISAALHNG